MFRDMTIMLILGILLGGCVMNIINNNRGVIVFPYSFLKDNLNFAPQNYIDEEQILIYNDSFVVKGLNNISKIGVAGTGSMRPVIHKNHTIIYKKHPRIDDLKIGDMLMFNNYEGTNILHRVIEMGIDKNGWYVKTKGDSNNVNDIDIIRQKDINGVVVGIIY